jgi:hypothetical protein
MSDKQQIISDFIETLTSFVDNVADVCPNTIIGDNKSTIMGIIKKKENHQKTIDVFVSKILVYKPEIDSGDESFFLNKSYDDDVQGMDGGDMITGKIFEFKNIWTKLNGENKQIVIQYMQFLCLLAQNYFMLADSA